MRHCGKDEQSLSVPYHCNVLEPVFQVVRDCSPYGDGIECVQLCLFVQLLRLQKWVEVFLHEEPLEVRRSRGNNRV